jgi:opacity protein-like surface antigen
MKKNVLAVCLMMAAVTPVTAFAQELQPPPPPRPLPPPQTEVKKEVKAVPSQSSGRLTPQTTTHVKETAQAPGSAPVGFAVNQVEVRQPKTGWNLGVFGGVNFLQDTADDFGLRIQNPVPPASRGDIRGGQVGAIGGIKLGYDWPFSDEPIEQFEKETAGLGGIRLSGGLEAEAFYAYLPWKARLDTGGDAHGDFHAGVFMLNALLKGQIGKFRPYAGPGIGAAYIHGTNYDVLGVSQGEDDTVELAFQILAGVDYFISDGWSVFGEYRFLDFIDVNIFGQGRSLKADDFQTQHLSIGIRRHF